MTRLDDMIARLATQRACLEYAARLVAELPGPIFELGLGKGRTYAHLRMLFSDREIFAFDRDVHAPPDCVPDSDHLILGELRESLPRKAGRAGAAPAFIHADLGTENPERDRATMAVLAPLIAAAVRPGGIVLADRVLEDARLAPLPLPPGLPDWPYYLYRAVTGGS